MSPRYFSVTDATALEFGASPVGQANYYWIIGSYGVRPVINLHGDVEISSGIGTANDPFVIKTE